MVGRREFSERYGPWALITGGSEGLGRAFAEQLADRGLNLLLVGLDDPALPRAASELAARGVQVRTLGLDLTAPDAAGQVIGAASGLEVGLVVSSTALVVHGEFLGRPVSDLLGAVDVNCRVPLTLCHHFAGGMRRRGRGGLVLLTSMAGRQGAARVATYAATKAYNWVLGEGLWEELREHGVDVLACAPGLTRTETLQRSGANVVGSQAPLQDPEEVVREALEALGQRPYHITGRLNRASAALLGKLLPRPWSVRLVGRSMRDLYP